jgi:hypothetical protein
VIPRFGYRLDDMRDDYETTEGLDGVRDDCEVTERREHGCGVTSSPSMEVREQRASYRVSVARVRSSARRAVRASAGAMSGF